MTTAPASPPPGALARRLGTRDAVVIGLGSMIGAGLFTAFAPAAAAAGTWLLLGLALAGLVAWANATSSAQLAARYPASGGTYLFGREVLGPWWGFLAGWGFVVGKTASCAAMALTIAAYVAPGPWQRPLAGAVVIALASVGYRGVTRTARVTRVLVAVVLAVLLAWAVAVAPDAVAGWTGGTVDGGGPLASGGAGGHGPGVGGVLQSAGLLFFAFAGYARVTTLGEEVRDPARTIPRAVQLALAGAVAVYAVVALLLLGTLGPDLLAASTAPLVAAAGGSGWVAVAVRVAAVLAASGALLALLAGVSRTALAMAREGDLPPALAAVHPRWHVPHRAELAVAAVVVVLVLAVDLRGAIGFSSFGVLTYYLVANASALRQPAAERRFPRGLAVLGAVGCVALAVTLPVASVLGGLAVLAVGVAGRSVTLRRRRTGAPDGGGPQGGAARRAGRPDRS